MTFLYPSIMAYVRSYAGVIPSPVHIAARRAYATSLQQRSLRCQDDATRQADLGEELNLKICRTVPLRPSPLHPNVQPPYVLQYPRQMYELYVYLALYVICIIYLYIIYTHGIDDIQMC